MTTEVLDYPPGIRTGQALPQPRSFTGLLWGLPFPGGSTGSARVWISHSRVMSAQNQAPVGAHAEPASVLRDIRRISGLTLEELAFALNVSRRTLHNWDAGQPVRSLHLEALHRLADLLRRMDCGNPIRMRNLLHLNRSGRSALAMIRESQWTAAEALLAPSVSRQPLPAALPEAEARRRRPQGVSIGAYANESLEVLPDRPLPRVKIPGLRKR